MFWDEHLLAVGTRRYGARSSTRRLAWPVTFMTVEAPSHAQLVSCRLDGKYKAQDNEEKVLVTKEKLEL